MGSSTYLGYCNQDHMERGMIDDPQWYENSTMKEMFEIFELKDKQKLQPKPKAKEISKLQVRPLKSNK